ncbi:hypothetical protein D3C83_260660 [compost metagenome]
MLSFEAVANRTYAIEQRPALQTGSWSNYWNLAPASTNRLIQTTNPVSSGDSGFYRLLVSP